MESWALSLVLPSRPPTGQRDLPPVHPTTSGAVPSLPALTPRPPHPSAPLRLAPRTPQPWVPTMVTAATRRRGASSPHHAIAPLPPHQPAGRPPAPLPRLTAPPAPGCHAAGTTRAGAPAPAGGAAAGAPAASAAASARRPAPAAVRLPCRCPSPAAALQSPPHAGGRPARHQTAAARACAARCPACTPRHPRPKTPACGVQPVLPGHGPCVLGNRLRPARLMRAAASCGLPGHLRALPGRGPPACVAPARLLWGGTAGSAQGSQVWPARCAADSWAADGAAPPAGTVSRRATCAAHCPRIQRHHASCRVLNPPVAAASSPPWTRRLPRPRQPLPPPRLTQQEPVAPALPLPLPRPGRRQLAGEPALLTWVLGDMTHSDAAAMRANLALVLLRTLVRTCHVKPARACHCRRSR